MRRSRLFPKLALLGALAMVTAACGQKAGVHLASEGSGVPVDAEGNPVAVDAQGNPIVGVDAEGNPVVGGSGGAAGGTAGSTTKRSGATGGSTATTVGGGGATPTTRVWGKTIMLGIHAPITGAAPLPSTFQKAANDVKAYFNANANLPGGRTIDIKIVDDEYQPAVATSRCRELVQQSNAFMLLGAAGTDQIQACARYAATVGVPYLSAGVTESGLTTLKNYFAASMSYKAQAPYLANFMKQKFPELTSDPASVYMVYADTPNFKDAVAGFSAAFPGVRLKKVSRVPSASELQTAAQDICTEGRVPGGKKVKIAYPLMAPKDWLILLGAQPSGCRPQWSGVGVTMGINELAGTACSQNLTRDNFNGSTFFSPAPGVDVAASLDPEFKKATNNNPAAFDDIHVALWGSVKTIVELLRRAGPDLNRAGFVKSTENATNVTTGMTPTLNFTPTDHFGADTVHVLQADCATSKYKTIATFAKF